MTAATLLTLTVATLIFSIKFGGHGPLLLLPFLPLLSSMFVVWVISVPIVVHVGDDGFAWSWLLWQGFVPHSAVARIQSSGRSVFTPRSRLVVTTTAGAQLCLGDYKQSLERPLRWHRKAHRRMAPASIHPLLLAGERSPEQWFEQLARLPKLATPRKAAPSRADLWHLLESHRSPPPQRGAAAIALGALLDERERSRLNRIMAVTAHRDLWRVMKRLRDGKSRTAREAFLCLASATAAASTPPLTQS